MIDDNLLLELLKGIRAAVDRNTERLDDMNHRISSVEQQVVGLRFDSVNASA